MLGRAFILLSGVLGITLSIVGLIVIFAFTIMFVLTSYVLAVGLTLCTQGCGTLISTIDETYTSLKEILGTRRNTNTIGAGVPIPGSTPSTNGESQTP